MIAVATTAVALSHPAPGLADRAQAAHTRPRPPFKVRRARHRRRLRAAVVRWAASRIGMPYVYGASGPYAFDCSGLTRWAYAHVGRYLPHSSYSQARAGVAVRGPLKRGDLVLAYADGHVAIYAGHGIVIAAPHTGSVVQREPLSWLPWTAARRLIHRG